MYNSKNFFMDLKDVYLGYTHKWMDVNSKTIPIPYFSRKEISEHEYKLTYSQWKKIIDCYIKNVFDYIFDGNTFPIPHGLGSFSITKTKRKLINRKQTSKQGKLVAVKLLTTYNYKPRICWNTAKLPITNKNFYKFILVRPLWSKVMEMYKEDGSQILKLKDNKRL